MLQSCALRVSRPLPISSCSSYLKPSVIRLPLLATWNLQTPSPGSYVQSPRQHPKAFTTSRRWQKKVTKAARDAASTSTSTSSVDDPSDLSSLESAVSKAIDKLRDDLSKLRPGGRFNPEILEAVRVQLKKGSKESVRLGDVAQVVPKGRTVQVVVGEPDHVKPVITAIQSSNLSLTPQADPTNRSTLNITIPPPTGESRQAAIDMATKAGEAANTAVRNARQAHQKRIRTAELARLFRPDDLRRAGKSMEEIVAKETKEVTKIVDEKKKVLGHT